MKAILVDADPLIYRHGFANETGYVRIMIGGEAYAELPTKTEAHAFCAENEIGVDEYELEIVRVVGEASHAIASLRRAMASIRAVAPQAQCHVFAGGSSEARRRLYPAYKSGRAAKPLLYDTLLKYLIDREGAALVTNWETDDEVVMQASAYNPNDVVIASIDKDLRTKSCWHYNYVTDVMDFVSALDASRNFYTQLLMGDAADKVPGCRGIGSTKAAQLLADAEDEIDMCLRVWQAYQKAGHDYSWLLMNGRLLHMLRHPDDVWQPPVNLEYSDE